MILFDNKTKIKWDHDNHLESKVKWKKTQFQVNQMLKYKIKKKSNKKKISFCSSQPANFTT
jgi:hypothetical protein